MSSKNTSRNTRVWNRILGRVHPSPYRLFSLTSSNSMDSQKGQQGFSTIIRVASIGTTLIGRIAFRSVEILAGKGKVLPHFLHFHILYRLLGFSLSVGVPHTHGARDLESSCVFHTRSSLWDFQPRTRLVVVVEQSNSIFYRAVPENIICCM